MIGPSRLHRYTYADYVALEQTSSTKHEFLGGEIYAMAGGSAAYQTIPSLADYIVVSHRERRVTVYSREPGRGWTATVGVSGGAVPVQSVATSLAIDEVYRASAIASP